MNSTCDFADQPTYDRSNLIRPKMLSLTDLMSVLPHASCSARAPENQLTKETQYSSPFKRMVAESENLSSFFYNLGAVQTNIVHHVEELRQRFDEMMKKSQETEEWQKKTDRKFLLTYVAVGALAVSCFGKQAWAKIKTYSANFKW